MCGMEGTKDAVEHYVDQGNELNDIASSLSHVQYYEKDAPEPEKFLGIPEGG